jgi:hypothetical protein
MMVRSGVGRLERMKRVSGITVQDDLNKECVGNEIDPIPPTVDYSE